jgi:hypothetical protein
VGFVRHGHHEGRNSEPRSELNEVSLDEVAAVLSELTTGLRLSRPLTLEQPVEGLDLDTYQQFKLILWVEDRRGQVFLDGSALAQATIRDLIYWAGGSEESEAASEAGLRNGRI